MDIKEEVMDVKLEDNDLPYYDIPDLVDQNLLKTLTPDENVYPADATIYYPSKNLSDIQTVAFTNTEDENHAQTMVAYSDIQTVEFTNTEDENHAQTMVAYSDIPTVEFTNTEDENHAQTMVASDDELELPKGKTYRCSICGYIALYNSILTQHKAKHSVKEKQQSFACAHCNNKYRTDNDLQDHIDTCHSDSRPKKVVHQQFYRCSLCGYQTPRKSSYIQHKVAHMALEERQLFACSQCNKKYTSITGLRYHIVTCHINSRNVSSINEVESEDFLKVNPDDDAPKQDEDLHNDFKAKEIQETYTCSTCGIITPYESVYRQHMTSHLSPEERQLFTYAHCNKEYTLKRSLKRHLNPNHNEARAKEIQETYTCSTCGIITPYESVYRRHMTRHLPPEKRQLFTCAYCNKQYTLKRSLNRHLNNNHNEARAKEIQETYTCSTCEFITLSESVCRRHMTRHLPPEKRQLFTCAYCNKQYTLKRSLNRHLNNNHNEARNAAHVPVTNEEEPEEFLNVEPDNDAPKFDEDMHDEFKITDQEEVKLENVIKMEPSYDSSFLNWKMKIGKFY